MILGLADLAEAPEAIAYANQLRDVARAWNGKTFTAAQALPLLAAVIQADTANIKRGLSLPKEVHGETARRHQAEAKRDLTQAQYLHKLLAAKGKDPHRFAVGQKVWADVRAAVLAPITWRSTVVATTAVENAAQTTLYTEIIAGVLRLPGVIVGGAAGYVIGQARDALVKATAPLGIPAWAAPVALVAAGLLVLGPYVSPLVARTIGGFKRG